MVPCSHGNRASTGGQLAPGPTWPCAWQHSLPRPLRILRRCLSPSHHPHVRLSPDSGSGLTSAGDRKPDIPAHSVHCWPPTATTSTPGAGNRSPLHCYGPRRQHILHCGAGAERMEGDAHRGPWGAAGQGPKTEARSQHILGSECTRDGKRARGPSWVTRCSTRPGHQGTAGKS